MMFPAPERILRHIGRVDSHLTGTAIAPLAVRTLPITQENCVGG